MHHKKMKKNVVTWLQLLYIITIKIQIKRKKNQNINMTKIWFASTSSELRRASGWYGALIYYHFSISMLHTMSKISDEIDENRCVSLSPCIGRARSNCAVCQIHCSMSSICKQHSLSIHADMLSSFLLTLSEFST